MKEGGPESGRRADVITICICHLALIPLAEMHLGGNHVVWLVQ